MQQYAFRCGGRRSGRTPCMQPWLEACKWLAVQFTGEAGRQRKEFVQWGCRRYAITHSFRAQARQVYQQTMSISNAIRSIGRWIRSLLCQYFREALLSVFGANHCTLHLVWKGWLTRTNMCHSRHRHLSHSAARHLASSIARSPFP